MRCMSTSAPGLGRVNCTKISGVQATAQRGRSGSPNAAQWNKPPLIKWQRSLEDALWLAKAKNLPLLICVNMDGERGREEPASANFAGVRYRDPGFAALVESYIPLIVSPDRHTPTDHDGQGRRVPCPRFGTVTCTEHISIELELFARFFNGRRVAPRHLAVTADGKQLFDRFLDGDLTRVDDALEENASTNHHKIAESFSLLIRGPLANPDARTRSALELRFSKADRAERIAILAAAADASFELFDLLRIGLKDSDPTVRDRAALTLAATANDSVTALVVDTTDRVEHTATRRALFGTLFHIGLTDPTARWALQIRQGLLAEGETVKAKNWLKAVKEQSTGTQKEYASDFVPNDELDQLDQKIATLTNKAEQEDAKGVHHLGLAEANFRYALNSMQNRGNPEFFFQDADTAAVAAGKRGATKWAVAALRARIAYLSGRKEEATYNANGQTIDPQNGSAHSLTKRKQGGQLGRLLGAISKKGAWGSSARGELPHRKDPGSGLVLRSRHCAPRQCGSEQRLLQLGEQFYMRRADVPAPNT